MTRLIFFRVMWLTVLMLQVFAASAQQAVGPQLAAASNLSQGRQEDVLRLASELGVSDFRDGANWNRVETRPGHYTFDNHRLSFPTEIDALGAEVSMVLNWGNTNYEDGNTPVGLKAVSAFGEFAGELVSRFPAVTSLEIGNEFNGVNFVRGPIRKLTPRQRARAYVPLLASAATAARAKRPGIRISGGATHSMAAGYLWEVLDAGGADYLDTLAIHPYTTDAEQLVRQVEVLRRHPAAKDLPIEITEFGTKSFDDSASHMLRNYCQMALSGVSRVVWYPLNERGDKLVPLFSTDSNVTPAGQAYRFIAARMEGRSVENAALDPFTWGCQFENDVLILWGAARSVKVPDRVEVLDSAGDPVTGPFSLTPDSPLVFVAKEPEDLVDIEFGDPRLIADSYSQFAYPIEDEAQASGDSFERFAEYGDVELPLVTLPGQQKRSVPWYPYRGNPDLTAVRLTADNLLPGSRNGSAIEIVHRYTATKAARLDLSSRFAVTDRSNDGITVSVRMNGQALAMRKGLEPIEIDMPGLDLVQGDQLEIAVGPNSNNRGDITNYRIVLHRSASIP